MVYTQLLKRFLPQTRPLPGQVKNNAGGYAFSVTPWQRLARFLVMGAESRTYYQTASELTRESAKVVLECASLDARRTVELIASFSDEGRAASNSPALFALALVCAAEDSEARRLACAARPRVVRTGAHLLEFAQMVCDLRGFGRAMRRSIAGYYAELPERELCYQLVKYRNRSGFTHRDVLRLVHPLASPEPADSLRRRAGSIALE